MKSGIMKGMGLAVLLLLVAASAAALTTGCPSDTENVFHVCEETGTVGDYRVIVLHYPGEDESAGAYEYAIASFSGNTRFKTGNRQGNRYSMVDREQELVMIEQTGRYISIVTGHKPDKVKEASARLIEKLKDA